MVKVCTEESNVMHTQRDELRFTKLTQVMLTACIRCSDNHIPSHPGPDLRVTKICPACGVMGPLEENVGPDRGEERKARAEEKKPERRR